MPSRKESVVSTKESLPAPPPTPEQPCPTPRSMTPCSARRPSNSSQVSPTNQNLPQYHSPPPGDLTCSQWMTFVFGVLLLFAVIIIGTGMFSVYEQHKKLERRVNIHHSGESIIDDTNWPGPEVREDLSTQTEPPSKRSYLWQIWSIHGSDAELEESESQGRTQSTTPRPRKRIKKTKQETGHTNVIT